MISTSNSSFTEFCSNIMRTVGVHVCFDMPTTVGVEGLSNADFDYFDYFYGAVLCLLVFMAVKKRILHSIIQLVLLRQQVHNTNTVDFRYRNINCNIDTKKQVVAFSLTYIDNFSEYDHNKDKNGFIDLLNKTLSESNNVKNLKEVSILGIDNTDLICTILSFFMNVNQWNIKSVRFVECNLSELLQRNFLNSLNNNDNMSSNCTCYIMCCTVLDNYHKKRAVKKTIANTSFFTSWKFDYAEINDVDDLKNCVFFVNALSKNKYIRSLHIDLYDSELLCKAITNLVNTATTLSELSLTRGVHGWYYGDEDHISTIAKANLVQALKNSSLIKLTIDTEFEDLHQFLQPCIDVIPYMTGLHYFRFKCMSETFDQLRDSKIIKSIITCKQSYYVVDVRLSVPVLRIENKKTLFGSELPKKELPKLFSVANPAGPDVAYQLLHDLGHSKVFF